MFANVLGTKARLTLLAATLALSGCKKSEASLSATNDVVSKATDCALKLNTVKSLYKNYQAWEKGLSGTKVERAWGGNGRGGGVVPTALYATLGDTRKLLDPAQDADLLKRVNDEIADVQRLHQVALNGDVASGFKTGMNKLSPIIPFYTPYEGIDAWREQARAKPGQVSALIADVEARLAARASSLKLTDEDDGVIDFSEGYAETMPASSCEVIQLESLAVLQDPLPLDDDPAAAEVVE